MDAAAAHGANKSKCRIQTILHAKHYMGEEQFRKERFAVLLGPEACDVFDLRGAGNEAGIIGFEHNDDAMRSAIIRCAARGIQGVVFASHVENNIFTFNSAIFDWCASTAVTLPLTIRTLKASWQPNLNSSLTIGVSYGRPDSTAMYRGVKGYIHEMAHTYGGIDYAAGLARLIHREVEGQLHEFLRMAQLRLYHVATRSYKSGDGSTNMLYVTFRVVQRSVGRFPNVIRKHYHSPQPQVAKVAAQTDLSNETQLLIKHFEEKKEENQDMSKTKKTQSTGTTAALKAWETRRANEAKAKRSEAARKAAQTRRENAARRVGV